MNTGKRTATTYGALDAFFPAVLALSGDLDARSAYRGRRSKCGSKRESSRKNLITKRREITSPGYPLRPEIVESTYYLHHYTKNPAYLRMGETIWNDFVKTARTDDGYAALKV